MKEEAGFNYVLPKLHSIPALKIVVWSKDRMPYGLQMSFI
jgi:hypothetical protein